MFKKWEDLKTHSKAWKYFFNKSGSKCWRFLHMIQMAKGTQTEHLHLIVRIGINF